MAMETPRRIPAPAETNRFSPRALVSIVGLPALSFLLLIAAWQILVVGLRVPEYILPPPSTFLARLWTARTLLWSNSLITASEVILGFALAATVSVPLALLVTSTVILEQALYPVIVFFQLIPKIAVAPLFIVWFGIGQPPKVFLTFLLCFFPILVDSMSGFKAIDSRLLYLTQSMGATRWQTFRYIRLPAALPFIMSGFKVAIVFASTGAIVGEFVGANAGLGYLLLRGASYLDTGLIFAVLMALSVMGLALSYGVAAIEHALMPWKGREE